jgi:hypothetical protein
MERKGQASRCKKQDAGYKEVNKDTGRQGESE